MSKLWDVQTRWADANDKLHKIYWEMECRNNPEEYLDYFILCVKVSIESYSWPESQGHTNLALLHLNPYDLLILKDRRPDITYFAIKYLSRRNFSFNTLEILMELFIQIKEGKPYDPIHPRFQEQIKKQFRKDCLECIREGIEHYYTFYPEDRILTKTNNQTK